MRPLEDTRASTTADELVSTATINDDLEVPMSVAGSEEPAIDDCVDEGSLQDSQD